jgi:hypothetical protein
MFISKGAWKPSPLKGEEGKATSLFGAGVGSIVSTFFLLEKNTRVYEQANLKADLSTMSNGFLPMDTSA